MNTDDEKCRVCKVRIEERKETEEKCRKLMEAVREKFLLRKPEPEELNHGNS